MKKELRRRERLRKGSHLGDAEKKAPEFREKLPAAPGQPSFGKEPVHHTHSRVIENT